MNQERNGKKVLFCIGMLLLYGAVTALVVGLLVFSGRYPSGADTMCHVYKGKKLYQEILQGNLYPLLDMRWYNGVEILRYWAPLPVYTMAGCIGLAAGNEMFGYLIYVAIICFFGSVVWLIIGKRMGRLGLGAFLGFLWFFMPNNLYALFYEGNLPRSLSMVFLPWLFYQIYEYCTKKKSRYLLGIMVTFSLITLCHLGYAGMILLSFLLFFVVYILGGGKARKGLHSLVFMVLGITVMGIWVYPSLQGGIASMDSAETMAGFFQPFFTTINPLLRSNSMTGGYFYFGCAAFMLTLIGIIAGRNGAKPYFITAIILLLLTTSAAYPVLSRMPLGQYLWMLRFISIALCMIFVGMLLWKTVKRWILLLSCVLLLVDTVPSLTLIYGNLTGQTPQERMEKLAEQTLINQAKDITKQRMALMDKSTLEANGAYLSSDFNQETDICFGAGWQSANTANNIMMLNEAMDSGSYLYLFDRCLELGNDTVLIQISCLQYKSADIEKLDRAALIVGYELVDFNEEYRLYHMDTPKQFGVVSRFMGAGIGTAAPIFSLCYPGIEALDRINLNDYTFEDLQDYEFLYLEGFTYRNKKSAEELVLQLAESGVKVVISASGIPKDESTGIQSFLGVDCQVISFSNGYPLLETSLGIIDTRLFREGHTQWKTVYLEGLDRCLGKVRELDRELEFLGTVKNENIFIIGFGLPYHYELTHDEAVGKLLSEVIDLDSEEIPVRQLVPLDVQVYPRMIEISSDYDNVNTTLAYHDIYETTSVTSKRNNLLYVNAGNTIVYMNYPYLPQGCIVSIASVVLAFILAVWAHAFWKRRDIEAVEVFGIQRPVAEKTPSYEYLLPTGAKYRVISVEWFDSEGKLLSSADCFVPGKYCLRVKTGTLTDERFAKDMKVVLNNMQPDKLDWLSTNELSMELNYTVTELFKITKQPVDAVARVGEPFAIEWAISQSAKVGYLQIWESGNWVISDVVPYDTPGDLTYPIKSDMIGSVKYRIIYIVGTGQTVYSHEFTIDWTKGES